MRNSYKSLIFAAALACFARVSAAPSSLARPKTFIPSPTTAANAVSRSEAKNVMYQLRGGAGPLDAVDTTKVGSAIALVSGVLHSISAGKLLEGYGSERTPTLELCLRNIGASSLGTGIPAFCLLNGKCSSTNTAIGLSILPWIVTTLKAVVDGDSASVKTNPQLFVLLYEIFTAHALFTDAGYATKALHAFCVWVLANGIFLVMSPKGAATSWGGNADPEDQVVSMTKTNGFGLFRTVLSSTPSRKCRCCQIIWIQQVLLATSHSGDTGIGPLVQSQLPAIALRPLIVQIHDEGNRW